MEANASYLSKMSQWLQRRTGLPPDDAVDLVHEAFARCLSRLRLQNPADTPELLASRITTGMLRKVVHDLWVDRLRAQAHEQNALSRYAITHIVSPPSEADWLDYQAALEVTERLESFWQEVLWWRVEGYSWKEIAQWTGKPVGTLASGLERALDEACAELGYTRQKNRRVRKKTMGSNGIINGSSPKSVDSGNIILSSRLPNYEGGVGSNVIAAMSDTCGGYLEGASFVGTSSNAVTQSSTTVRPPTFLARITVHVR